MNKKPIALHPRHRHSGFTLAEIMIVAVIIGLLAALAIPAMLQARENARGARFINDLRQARAVFETYAMDQGAYPDDGFPAVAPDGMDELLAPIKWTADTPIGGQWDWDYRQFGVTAGVSVFRPTIDTAMLAKIDARIDDGDLSQGLFRERTAGYIYVIE